MFSGSIARCPLLLQFCARAHALPFGWPPAAQLGMHTRNCSALWLCISGIWASDICGYGVSAMVTAVLRASPTPSNRPDQVRCSPPLPVNIFWFPLCARRAACTLYPFAAVSSMLCVMWARSTHARMPRLFVAPATALCSPHALPLSAGATQDH